MARRVAPIDSARDRLKPVDVEPPHAAARTRSATQRLDLAQKTSCSWGVGVGARQRVVIHVRRRQDKPLPPSSGSAHG
jgi:hypothetical protein